MTRKEYDAQMDIYKEKMEHLSDEELEQFLEEVYKFQYDFMEKVLEEYKKTVDGTAREVIYDILEYAVHSSQSGNSIRDVYSQEDADKVEEIIWNEIGDYLLDYSIYKEKDHWAIDCTFAGYYVPQWDGFTAE